MSAIIDFNLFSFTAELELSSENKVLLLFLIHVKVTFDPRLDDCVQAKKVFIRQQKEACITFLLLALGKKASHSYQYSSEITII